MKICSRCKVSKEVSFFGLCSRSRDRLKSACKLCTNEMGRVCEKKHSAARRVQRKTYRSLHKDKFKSYRKRANLIYNYGMTVENFNQMSLTQKNRCAVCNQIKKLVVDHCHTTGKIRGLLCQQCNSGLRYFKDSLYNLTSAYRYIFQFEPRNTINREVG